MQEHNVSNYCTSVILEKLMSDVDLFVLLRVHLELLYVNLSLKCTSRQKGFLFSF